MEKPLLSKKKIIVKATVGIFCSTAAILLFCSSEYNPFTDPSNARVYFSSPGFVDSDSVALYETGTFRVVVSAREAIAFFTISAPKNRYWTDTVIQKTSSSDAALSRGPYLFDISFFDTGQQKVTLTTSRSNGEELQDTMEIRVYQPLFQKNVTGYFGDTIVLHTSAVPDDKKGVLYHWNLGGNWNIASVSNRCAVPIPLFSPSRGTGSLTVSNLSGQMMSPAFTFSYTLNDTSKPVIRCVNDSLRNDTIFSADTVFPFKVYVADAGGAEVDSCTINNMSFDFVDRSRSVYTRLYRNLPDLAEDNIPLTVSVFALDNQQFRNTTLDTFYILFDPQGAISADAQITFNQPYEDSATTSRSSFIIHGGAQSDRGDTMVVTCSVNGTEDPATAVIVGADEWSWPVSLTSTYTTVTVSAFSTGGSLLASAKRTIVYDPDAVDTIKPVIWEVSANGQLLGSQFYTDQAELPLKIVAFDEGSGMAYLRINQDTIKSENSSYEWRWNTGDLAHGLEGTPFRISAVDNSGNIQERTVVIYKNGLPSPVGELEIPDECCAENTFHANLYWLDADNDPVELETIKVPAGMTVSKEGAIDWKPVLRPETDKDTLIIELSDPYGKNRLQWIFTVIRCGKSEGALSFAIAEQDFPEILETGEHLNVSLTIDTNGILFIPKYSAIFIDNGKILLNNDTSGSILWTPQLPDTGLRKMMITVGDGLHDFDTLLPTFRVVPKNEHPCSLSVLFSGDTTFWGTLDLFTHPAPETLFFTINDEDNPFTESYEVKISMGSVHTVEHLDQNEFFIVIEPEPASPPDTLTVSVVDRSESIDSMRFVVQYVRSGENTPPKLTGNPEFPIYCCADSLYEFRISGFDADTDTVVVVTVHAPPGMTVSPDGNIQWTPLLSALGDDSLVVRFTDLLDSSVTYSWPVTSVDCDNMPPAVSFATTVEDFPELLQADRDTVSLQLVIDEETGVEPFAFNGEMDNGRTILDNNTGVLLWVPTASDTGKRSMTITVIDRFLTTDTLAPQFTVIPRNGNPCGLSYTWSGITLPSGQLTHFTTTEPESALFIISDADLPLTEQYRVIIDRGDSTGRYGRSSPDTLNLAGDERTFSLKIHPVDSSISSGAPSGHSRYYQRVGTDLFDTFTVSISDSTGTADTVRLFVRYPISDPDSVPDILLNLNASEGVTTSFGGRVSRWSLNSDTSYPFPYTQNSLSQTDMDRQPVLVNNAINGQPAIRFDHITDNGDDLLYNTTYTQWSDTPFTVIVVFSIRSHPVPGRMTLVSSNTVNGFGIGVTCDSTIGIFNDVAQFNCFPEEQAGTDLDVSTGKWYIATWQSSLGISVGGYIRVQAWLNGTAASEIMELTTLSNAGMAVGNGSTNYDGALDGYIASIIIYERALSEDERILVERYLGNLYDITVE